MERLRRGTYFAHISEHVTLELQNLMGFNVSFGRARGTGEHAVYNVIIAYEEEESALPPSHSRLWLTIAAMHDLHFDIEAEKERLLNISERYRLGPSTSAIVDAARRRRIPTLRLLPTRSLIQLGYGRYQKRIEASETSCTSAIAVDLCQEKPLTNRLLAEAGLPVPEGRVVELEDEAWTAAQEIGLPVVTKPDDGHQGKGVAVSLASEEAVRCGYRIANDYTSSVLVERHIAGNDFRLLIADGHMVAAARRDPPAVVGDGTRSIRELVKEINRDPRRRDGHTGQLSRVTIDDTVELTLRSKGMSLDAVPGLGQQVVLRHNICSPGAII